MFVINKILLIKILQFLSRLHVQNGVSGIIVPINTGHHDVLLSQKMPYILNICIQYLHTPMSYVVIQHFMLGPS